MSDSPLACCFSPPCGCFPIQLGDPGFSCKLMQVLYMAPIAIYAALKNALCDRKVIVFMKLSQQCNSWPSCSCLCDTLPSLELWAFKAAAWGRWGTGWTYAKERGSHYSPGENGPFTVARDTAVSHLSQHNLLSFCVSFSYTLFVLWITSFSCFFPVLLPPRTNISTFATGLVKLNEALLPVKQSGQEVKWLSE